MEHTTKNIVRKKNGKTMDEEKRNGLFVEMKSKIEIEIEIKTSREEEKNAFSFCMCFSLR